MLLVNGLHVGGQLHNDGLDRSSLSVGRLDQVKRLFQPTLHEGLVIRGRSLPAESPRAKAHASHSRAAKGPSPRAVDSGQSNRQREQQPPATPL